MYSVSVRDHFMIAHSFTGEVFGPAQRLHGATYVVDVEFRRPGSTPTASSSTSAARPRRCARCSSALNFRNLDEEPAFAGRNTTTEFLARAVFDRLVAAIGRRRARAAARRASRACASPCTNRTSRGRRSKAASAAASASSRGCAEVVSARPGLGSTAGPAATSTTAGSIAGLRARGWSVDVRELDASFPFPTPAALGTRGRACWRRCRDGTSSSSTGSRSARCRTRSSASRRACASSRSCIIRWRPRPASTETPPRDSQAASGGRWRRVGWSS